MVVSSKQPDFCTQLIKGAYLKRKGNDENYNVCLNEQSENADPRVAEKHITSHIAHYRDPVEQCHSDGQSNNIHAE